MFRSIWIYWIIPLCTGSQNILAFIDQTFHEHLSKINLSTCYIKFIVVGKESKILFTLDPSDTWRLFISGKDPSKLDVPILKWWGSAEVVSHDVESESMWFVSSEGERFIICTKYIKSTKELSIQLPYQTLLLWTRKAKWQWLY